MPKAKYTMVETTETEQQAQHVKLSDLVASKVTVIDDAGNLFYLEAIRTQGQFTLRPVVKG